MATGLVSAERRAASSTLVARAPEAKEGKRGALVGFSLLTHARVSDGSVQESTRALSCSGVARLLLLLALVLVLVVSMANPEMNGVAREKIRRHFV